MGDLCSSCGAPVLGGSADCEACSPEAKRAHAANALPKTVPLTLERGGPEIGYATLYPSGRVEAVVTDEAYKRRIAEMLADDPGAISLITQLGLDG